jgi:GH25 family lysozyme M1 (1,4-beta-N-acetylmuramidase)
MPELHFIDLSHWNEVSDWNLLAKSGIVGVIHKATQGTGYRDPDYLPRQDQALSRGLCWGAYHFLEPGRIEEQMAFFLGNASLAPGSRVVIDYEHEGLQLPDLHSSILALRDLDPGMQIAVYSGHTLKEQLGSNDDPLLATVSLWIAQYNNEAPEYPTGTWKHWSAWQYSDGEAGGYPREVPGAVLPIDCNMFNGSKEACARWFGPVTDEMPDAAVEAEPWDIEIRVAPGTRFLINGDPFTAS